MNPGWLTTSPRTACAGILFALLLLAGGGCGSAHQTEQATDTLHLTTMRIRGFDPAHSVDEASVRAAGLVYEGLLQYSYWTRPYRVEPLLAATMPELSADGKTWRFLLRSGIYFADDPCFVASGGKGRELMAADVAYSIRRIADTKVGSSGYWIYRGKIVGLDEFRAASQSEEPTDYEYPVAGLEVIGPHELAIHLNEPYPQLPWVLAMPYAFVVPREAVEYYGTDFVNHPVGTGPYVLAAYRQNYRYEYRTNPKWAETGRVDPMPAPDGAATGVALPQIPRIVCSVVGDPATAWLMFMAGQLDLTEISRDQWDSIMAPDQTLRPELVAKGIVLSKAPQMAVSYTSFNMDDPVVGNNKLLRQALTCAFDFDAWQTFQNGRVEKANGPVPPGVAGHATNPPPYSFDLSRARELLAAAGYPGGKDPATGRRLKLTLEIGQADNPEARQAAELLASFMEKIGVVVELSYNNWPTFLQKLERREAQMFSVSWLADYPDAQNFLQLFASENSSPGPNRANYHNPEFDRLYRVILALPPSPERDEACRAAQAILMEDCPWIITGHARAFNVRQARLQDYQRHDFSWGKEKYWRLAPTAP